MSTTKNKKAMWPALILLLVLLGVALFLNRSGSKEPSGKAKTGSSANRAPRTGRTESVERGLVRHPRKINYSAHAKCRMKCRHISQEEVKEILREGRINYKKSELQAGECQRRYAVEGVTHQEQHVRIIFAPCGNEETVVTVIDLGQEWACDCD